MWNCESCKCRNIAADLLSCPQCGVEKQADKNAPVQDKSLDQLAEAQEK